MADFELYEKSDHHWNEYKQKFSKSYKPEEEAEKRTKWEENIDMVNKHNQEYSEGKHTFTMGVNQFSDGTSPCCGGHRHHH